MKTKEPEHGIFFQHKQFSWAARGSSFRFAFAGLRSFFCTEHNAWIHAFASLVVFVMSCVLPISNTELILLVLSMTLVWLAEIINTAIEKTMDFISLEKHPQIKLVKDLAAAAVLIAAVAAFVIGTIIFLPKLIHYV